MKTPLDMEIEGEVCDVPVQYRLDLNSYIKGVQASRKIAQENVDRHQKINKAYFDRHTHEVDYKVSDLVWVYNPKVQVGLSKKLRRMWVGPYRICNIGPNYTYKLQDCSTLEILPTLFNASRLKPVIRAQHSAIREFMDNDRLANISAQDPEETPRLLRVDPTGSSEVSQSNKTGRCNGKSTKSTQQGSSSGTGKPSPSASNTCAKTARKISKGKSGRKYIQGSMPPLNQARTPGKANLRSPQHSEDCHGPGRKTAQSSTVAGKKSGPPKDKDSMAKPPVNKGYNLRNKGGT